MEEQKHQHKSSIFLCKKCKTEEVKIDKKPKEKKDEQQKTPEIIIIKPAGVHQDSKYVAQVGKRHVQFGARTYSDMTQHGSEVRKENYISRHQSREQQYYDPKNIDNYYTKSFWSYWVLWNKSSIFDSIEDLQKRLPQGIQIKYTKSSIEKQQRDLKKAITHDTLDNDE